jgi:hypothetical protein
MKYFEEFLKHWNEKNPGQTESISRSTSEFIQKILSAFSYKGQLKSLLLGHVQSGKTSQMLAAISALADKGFKLFILLTSDMTNLQSQTLERTLRFLPLVFNTCGETDYMRFKEGDLRSPTVIILKKNSSVLKSWKRELSSLERCKFEEMVILDDEADAVSLNTKINKKEISAINRLLREIGEISPSSIYIQVTATPQALLLQTKCSGWKPEIVHAFEPGIGYCGGSHFYGESSRCIKSISEYETKTLLESDEIPSGLQEALLSFLINSIYLMDFCKRDVCNFLIHPGVKISHHSVVEKKIMRLLQAIKDGIKIGSELLRSSLFQVYEDIKRTCLDLPNFDVFWNKLMNMTEMVQIQTLNSNAISGMSYEKGINILIGGNATGRGITFPGLQVVYYCRETKQPQADTVWQHSRIFGYDRIPEACRIFLPPKLLQIFRGLNEVNNAMFNMILEKGIDPSMVIELPEGINPTRKNVLDQESLILIVGDTNYFLSSPTHANTSSIDQLVGMEDKEEEITLGEAIRYLESIEVEEDNDRHDLDLYLNCLNTLKSIGEKTCYLIVRTDRDLTKGTGSLLSPNDRQKGANITEKTVLTLYRVNGQIEKGWNGFPVWIPNIKYPKGRCFYAST